VCRRHSTRTSYTNVVLNPITGQQGRRAQGVKHYRIIQPCCSRHTLMIHRLLIGPLINKQQFNQVKESVDAAVNDGAKILCGGTSEGLCYHPTVLTNVKQGSPFSCEETMMDRWSRTIHSQSSPFTMCRTRLMMFSSVFDPNES